MWSIELVLTAALARSRTSFVVTSALLTMILRTLSSQLFKLILKLVEAMLIYYPPQGTPIPLVGGL